MKEYFLYITFLILLIVSCKQETKENTIIFESEINKHIELTNVEEQYIENDVLLDKMEVDLNELTKNPKFKIEKELVNNRHVDNLVDTVKLFKFDKITIQSYKTVSEEWVIDAQIRNSEFSFAKTIKIGIKKKTLENILKTKLNSDIITVGNLTETSEFVFKFEKDILKEIDYNGYLD